MSVYVPGDRGYVTSGIRRCGLRHRSCRIVSEWILVAERPIRAQAGFYYHSATYDPDNVLATARRAPRKFQHVRVVPRKRPHAESR